MKTRLISAFIAFVMLFQLSGVFAYTTKASDTDNVKAFLSQLGIINDISGSDDAFVSRAEFAAMTVRIMNINTRSFEYDTSVFSDIEESRFKEEILVAKKLGIINGVTSSEYMPEQKVSLPVAAKMLVCALDFGYIAEQLGGYPAGYMKLARDNNILNGVDTSSEALTYYQAYLLLYNALIADKAMFTSISGNDTQLGTSEGRSLLTENFKLNCIEGIITTSNLTAKNDAYAETGKVGINNSLFDTDLDTEEYFGCNVALWYNQSNEVVAIYKDSVNSVKVFSASDIANYSDYVLGAYSENDKIKNYSLDRGFTFILNGKIEECNKNSFDFTEGNVKLINNDGDSDYDYVIAEKLEYFIISAINTEENIIYDSNSTLKKLICKNDDEYMCSIKIDGTPSDFSALQKDMVLSVSVSNDKKVCKINASTKTVKGTINELGDETVITGSGEYKLNSYFNKSGNKLYPGYSYSFSLAFDGTVASAVQTNGGYKYGILLAYTNQTGNLSNKPFVKIFTQSDKVEIFEVSKDASIYINGTKKPLNEDNIDDYYFELIKYEEKDGAIKLIVTSSDYTSDWLASSSDADRYTLKKHIDNKKVYYRSGSYNYGSPGISFKGGLIFVVPSEFGTDGKVFDDEEFYIGTSSAFTDETPYNVDVYDFNEMLTPGVLLVRAKEKVNDIRTPSARATAYFVKKVSTALDSEGDISTLIKVLGTNKYEEFFIKDDVYNRLTDLPEPGDIIRLTTDKNGYVNGLCVDVDYTKTDSGYTLGVDYGSDNLGSSAHSMYTLFEGKVYNNSSDAIVIKYGASHPQGTYWYDMPGNLIRLELTNPRYLAYNVINGDTYVTDMESLSGSYYAGDEAASHVVLKTGYGCVTTVFIYTK